MLGKHALDAGSPQPQAKFAKQPNILSLEALAILDHSATCDLFADYKKVFDAIHKPTKTSQALTGVDLHNAVNIYLLSKDVNSMVNYFRDNNGITDTASAMFIAYYLINRYATPVETEATLVETEKPETPYQPQSYDITDDVYLQNDTWTDAELLFLQKLKKHNLKDLTKAYPKISDPLHFSLKNREEAIKQLLETANHHFEVHDLPEITKQQTWFLIGKGGTGSGKTRILTEIPLILRNSNVLDPIFKNTNIIYFNFTNGFSLTTDDRDKNSASMIVSRIVYAAFEMSLAIASSTPPSNNDLLIYEVIRIISQKLHSKYGDVLIPLILAFDEYQEATRANPSLSTSIQHKFGWYIRQIQRNHKILLIPAFGGTLTDNDTKMEPSQYTPVNLTLPSLRPKDIKEIMYEMGLKEHYDGTYRTFWNIVGIVPRHLDWALGNKIEAMRSLVLSDDTVKSTIYNNVTCIILKQYSSSGFDELFGEWALKTVSGIKIKVDQTIEKAISQGKVYINNGDVGLPLTVVDVLATTMSQIPKCVVSDFITTSNTYIWDRFEELCLKTMTARLSVLFTLPKAKKILLSELFKGAHFKSSLEKKKLYTDRAGWFNYTEADAKLTDNKDQNEKIINISDVKKTVKNQADVDGVLSVLKDKSGNRIVFVAQNKFQQLDSQQRTMGPADIAKFYKNAERTPFKEAETFVILFTNKRVSEETKEMVLKGEIIVGGANSTNSEKLILVSGDCFENFFHPYIGKVLVDRE